MGRGGGVLEVLAYIARRDLKFLFVEEKLCQRDEKYFFIT